MAKRPLLYKHILLIEAKRPRPALILICDRMNNQHKNSLTVFDNSFALKYMQKCFEKLKNKTLSSETLADSLLPFLLNLTGQLNAKDLNFSKETTTTYQCK